jgi:ParB family chromosome partitioning protein
MKPETVAEAIRGGCVLVVDNDAIRIGELYRKAHMSVAESVRYLIEAGHRLAAKRETLGYGRWLPWLEANAEVLGFDSRSTASRLMKLAAEAPNGALTQHLNEAEALRLNRIAWGNNVRGTQGGGEDEWWTPEPFLVPVREVFGGVIDLDPASCAEAQEIVRATRYLTKDDDGLRHEWYGNVYLNSPYSPPLIEYFVDKLITEFRAGRTTAAIMLTHNYTDVGWFHRAEAEAALLCFTSGRVKFLRANEVANPTQGQAFFYFGSEIEAFKRAFGRIGFIVRPEPQ